MKATAQAFVSANRKEMIKIVKQLSAEELVDMFICVAEAGKASVGVVDDIDGGTPANNRKETGEPDPFADYLGRKRSELPLGEYTDDQLANAIFMNYDVFPKVDDLLNGSAKMPIVYMTAGKERIRWLSRQVVALQDKLALLSTLSTAPQEPTLGLAPAEIPVTLPDPSCLVVPGTGDFKSIILKQLSHTPAKEIMFSEPLCSHFKKGGGLQRGSFYYIAAVTPAKQSHLSLIEGTDEHTHHDSAERGEDQGN